MRKRNREMHYWFLTHFLSFTRLIHADLKFFAKRRLRVSADVKRSVVNWIRQAMYLCEGSAGNDAAHHGAIVLKRLFQADDRCARFIAQLGQTKSRMQQTPDAFLTSIIEHRSQGHPFVARRVRIV